MSISSHLQFLVQLPIPTLTDLCINGGGVTFMDRGKGMEPVTQTFGLPVLSPENQLSLALELLRLAGKSWDASHPFVDGHLAFGWRLHIVFPPASPAVPVISLRRLPSAAARDTRPLWSGDPHYALLKERSQAGDSILVAGSTGCGKTTLIDALLSEVPESERIIALEDTAELNPRHPHFLRLLSRPPNADGFGQITLRDLLRQCLRMRPDRIVLGECRGEEVLDLLQILNTGHRGALATLHANSPRDALRRVELLGLLGARGQIPWQSLREWIAHGIQWVVQLQRQGDRRMISEVCRVEGYEQSTILLRPVLKSRDVPTQLACG